MVTHGTVSAVNVGPEQQSETPVVHIRVTRKVYDWLNREAKREQRPKSFIASRVLTQAAGKAVRDGK